MAALATQLPIRRNDLRITPVGGDGRYVVKDAQNGEYFQIGEEEHFLLMQLDGRANADAIRRAFEDRFGQPLSLDELEEFLEVAREQGFLQAPSEEACQSPDEKGCVEPTTRTPASVRTKRQSILYWRKSIFNPDRFFTWLEPKIRFFWTGGFLVISAVSIVLAALVLMLNSDELATSFHHALRWDTIIWTWLVLLIVTTLHEFAHGLTCKHHGSEVREIGFLLMFFMPCFYCNVSDAWLFREKSKRLWVTFAGGYFELFIWSLAVFVWRLTLPGSMPNHLAFLVAASSGVGTLFNFNPLIKLDGYYLLSDALEIPNLQQRGIERFKARLRSWIWGAPPPCAEPDGRTLLMYGLVSWLYSLVFLAVVLWGMFWFLGDKFGAIGMSAVTLLGLVSTRAMFKDTSSGEARKMLTGRQKRLASWLLVLGGVTAALCLIEINDYATGPFEVRAMQRAELRAAVSGFLAEVNVDEGESVSAGQVVARLEIPDLTSRIARKQAELREAQAELALLEAGPREVEIAQERRRVAAALAWRDVAALELKQQQLALDQDLLRLDKLLQEFRIEREHARQKLDRSEKLQRTRAVSAEEYEEAAKAWRLSQARYDRTEAERNARLALGTLTAQGALAEREAALTHAKATLELLQAGSRREKIDAAKAAVERLDADRRYLGELKARLEVRTPVSGRVTTHRLREKIGAYFTEGELICEVEDTSHLEVKIMIDEDRAAQIQIGQRVDLKVRALPFEVLKVELLRVAPRADTAEAQSKLTAYCRLAGLDQQLRSGMTGHARVYCGRGSIARVLATKALGFIRTEFWWAN